jgi:hypothetical protein
LNAVGALGFLGYNVEVTSNLIPFMLLMVCLSTMSSRHNMVPSFRFSLFSLLLLPFGVKSATIFNLVRNFNAPHRTGLVDFPHPALRFNSPYR